MIKFFNYDKPYYMGPFSSDQSQAEIWETCRGLNTLDELTHCRNNIVCEPDEDLLNFVRRWWAKEWDTEDILVVCHKVNIYNPYYKYCYGMIGFHQDISDGTTLVSLTKRDSFLGVRNHGDDIAIWNESEYNCVSFTNNYHGFVIPHDGYSLPCYRVNFVFRVFREPITKLINRD